MLRGFRIPHPTLHAISLTLGAIFLAAGCSSNPLAAKAPAIPTAEETTAMCAVVDRGTQAVSAAAPQGIGNLAIAKVQYFDELAAVIPTAWQDNLTLIRPAWEKLVEVAEAAGNDADKIDFDKFLADFSDATANETAWESYSALLCGPAGQ